MAVALLCLLLTYFSFFDFLMSLSFLFIHLCILFCNYWRRCTEFGVRIRSTESQSYSASVTTAISTLGVSSDPPPWFSSTALFSVLSVSMKRPSCSGARAASHAIIVVCLLSAFSQSKSDFQAKSASVRTGRRTRMSAERAKIGTTAIVCAATAPSTTASSSS